jgi:hypothetical protein
LSEDKYDEELFRLGERRRKKKRKQKTRRRRREVKKGVTMKLEKQ